MDSDRDDDRPVDRRIVVPAIIATAVLLVGGFALALTPSLLFHSRQASAYDGYRTSGFVLALLGLIPANVWALSVWWRRSLKPVLVVVLVVLTLVAAGIIYCAFIVIYLSTVDWFVF